MSTMREMGWSAAGIMLMALLAAPVALAELHGSSGLAADIAAVTCLLVIGGTAGIAWLARRRRSSFAGPGLELSPRRIWAACPGAVPSCQYTPDEWPATVYAGRAHVSGEPIETGPAHRMLPDVSRVQGDRAYRRIETVETAVREIRERMHEDGIDAETAAGELYAEHRLTIATGLDALDRIEAEEEELLDAYIRGLELGGHPPVSRDEAAAQYDAIRRRLDRLQFEAAR